MNRLLCRLGLLAAFVFLPIESHDGGHVHDEHSCGVEIPLLREELGNQIRIDAMQSMTDGTHQGRRILTGNTAPCDRLCDQCIEIKTFLHIIGTDLGFGPIIPHPTNTYGLALDNITLVEPQDFSSEDKVVTMFRNNMRVVNKAFQGTPFRFKFMRRHTTRTNHPDYSDAASDHKEELGRLVGNKNLMKLDCYVSASVRQVERGVILGTSTLPGSHNNGKADGVYIRLDTLTGGGRARNDRGYTLVHEISHWLGLLHTFQRLMTNEPCDAEEAGFGDFVDDTPMQSGPSSAVMGDCLEYLNGTMPPIDSCPDQPGNDTIFNFVNYVGNEECLAREGSFTCGQIERMNRHWLLFRQHVKSCIDHVHDMELEVIITFDSAHADQNQILLFDEQGSLLFDSQRDHMLAYLLSREDYLYMDICVPRNSTYKLQVVDALGDGFVDGSIDIFQDRYLVQTIRGDFGNETVIEIGPQEFLLSEAPSDSEAPSSQAPVMVPLWSPSTSPSMARQPSQAPVVVPSSSPSISPSVSSQPSSLPSVQPSLSLLPSLYPTQIPTKHRYTLRPTGNPTIRSSVLGQAQGNTMTSRAAVDHEMPPSTSFASSGGGGFLTAPSAIVLFLVLLGLQDFL